LEGVKQQTKLPEKTGNAFFNALPMSHFQKIVAATAKKNSARCTVQKDARGVDFLSNPEPNNLRYCLLHCPRVHIGRPDAQITILFFYLCADGWGCPTS